MFKQYQLKNYRFRLVAYVIVLTIIGILVIGSAKQSVQSKQILGLAIGLVFMVIVSLIDYSYILRFWSVWYLVWQFSCRLLYYFLEMMSMDQNDGLILDFFSFSHQSLVRFC